MVATSKKCFIKNWNLIDLDYHWKTGLIGLVQVEMKCRNLKNWHFEQKGVKIKTYSNFIFHGQPFKILLIK